MKAFQQLSENIAKQNSNIRSKLFNAISLAALYSVIIGILALQLRSLM